MESLKTILQKIEQPLNFASKENYRNISYIKDLGKSLQSLLALLKGTLPSSCSNDSLKLLGGLSEIFSDYDRKDLEIKKNKIKNALLLFEQLKIALDSIPVSQPQHLQDDKTLQRISDLKEAMAKLTVPIQYLKGVGPKMAERFATKKIATVEDLLYFLPRVYEDRREIKKINKLETGKTQTIIGTVILTEVRYYGKKRILEVIVSDNTANLTAKWFKGQMSYLTNTFKKGTRIIFTGNVTPNYAGKSMIHPDYEILDEEDEDNLLNFKRIVPIYSETEGLHQKYIRKIMNQALEQYSRYVSSPIPADICRKRNLLNIHEALLSVHFPAANESIDEFNTMQTDAHRRLIYDEFFFFQLGMAIKKSGRILEQGISFKMQGNLLDKFLSSLSFTLTDAQSRVIAEIQRNMAAATSMNRLLQGDVGSGKTVVAMAAMIRACENNYQAALMAPTEILAKQHYSNIKDWADTVGLKTILITGNMNAMLKNEKLEEINTGRADIVIGTHALIQEDVDFHRLGLVVIDEQHRFGVMQRATLHNKGINADVLVMTATPIPRTLAMTVYGDLDISVIDELPPQKKPVKTKIFYESQRSQVYEAIRKELKKHHQVFIVYPLVEESEALDLKDATRMAEHLQKDIFPDCKVGLIHGRLKARDKDEIMAGFLEKRIDILVSTTVIEVGIDIPQASLMVIEHAERFGLSQLHQLRGRVGRSDIASYCILLAQHRGSEDARKRLRIMEQTTDGFKIAEEDLAIRGPGEFMGIRQSGLPDFRVANILRDGQILNEAKTDAFELIEKDPFLEKAEHTLLKAILLHKWQGRLELAKTG